MVIWKVSFPSNMVSFITETSNKTLVVLAKNVAVYGPEPKSKFPEVHTYIM